MTKQETFDRVVNHLRHQGCKAVDDSGACVYRGTNGKRCSAGVLIPDPDYTPDMEGIKAQFNTLIKPVLERDGHNIFLVAELQAVHDLTSEIFWEEEFLKIAQKFGLVYTTPPMPLVGV